MNARCLQCSKDKKNYCIDLRWSILEVHKTNFQNWPETKYLIREISSSSVHKYTWELVILTFVKGIKWNETVTELIIFIDRKDFASPFSPRTSNDLLPPKVCH